MACPVGNGTTASPNLPVAVSNLADVTAIAGRDWHRLALKSDGSVWAWGYNSAGQLGDGTFTDRNVPVEVSGLANVIAIVKFSADLGASPVKAKPGDLPFSQCSRSAILKFPD
jgi:alpha-tubulin suppressor-like RCC1 family protein